MIVLQTMPAIKPSFVQNHYIRQHRNCTDKTCQKLYEEFNTALKNDSSDINKTHYFHGRYENIYYKNPNSTALKTFENDAINCAAKILKVDPAKLSMDYWFNEMPPEHITDWHRHDVQDEKLSGVYYLSTPDNSGDLIFRVNKQTINIKPKVNDFVFFLPELNHKVEANKSKETRLSIGMNFGFKT